MDNKNSCWCITAWECAPYCRKPELVRFIVWQREWTAQGQPHYQGYVEFNKPYSRTTVKGLFSQRSLHCEEPRKSRAMNMMYCLKPQSYAGERYMQEGTHTDNIYHEVDARYFHLTYEALRSLYKLETIES